MITPVITHYKGLKIEYNEWGLANRIGDTIVLNKHLKKNPWLHEILLDHEKGHTNKSLDLKHDFKSLKEAPFKEWIMKLAFMIQHPKSLVQLSPVWFYKGRPYLDASLIIMYILTAIIIYLFY